MRPIRRALRWAIYVLTAITVLVVIRNAINDQIRSWHHRQAVNQMLAVQNQCLNYGVPTDQTLFDPRVGVAFHPAIYDQLIKTLGPSFDRSSLGLRIGGGMLYMHQVTSVGGVRVLMIASLHEPPLGESIYMLNCYQIQLGDAQQPIQIVRVSSPLSIRSFPLTRIKGFAGYADPKDPSRFTLPLSVNGRAIAVGCEWKDDQTVRFTADGGQLVASKFPREGAALFFDTLPTPEDLLSIHYRWPAIRVNLSAH